jgi:HK97 family phage portal protein
MGLFRSERRASTFFGMLPDLPMRGYNSSAGVVVNDTQAMRNATVWACTWKYAKLISSQPYHAYREVGGVPTRLETPAVLREPSPGVRRSHWLSQQVVSLMLRGNCFGLVLGTQANGYPSGVQILHPDVVQAKYDWRTDIVEYRVEGQLVPNDRIWHTAINVPPGSPFGLSTIGAARQSIGMGIASMEYGSEWFSAGGHPTAVLKTDQEVNAEQATAIKSRWSDAMSDARGVAVLGQGFDYEAVQVSPQDAEFLNAYKISAQDICRFFDMPPEMVGLDSGSSMTYSNVESRALDLLRYSIDPVLVEVEAGLSELVPRGQYVKANRAALLQMTTTERYGAHASALRNGWRSVNEIRQLEELPPIDEGDFYLWPPFATSYEGDQTGVTPPPTRDDEE